MSIRWIRNVIIDNEKSTLEIQLGEYHIGDKCYTRIGSDLENWFSSISQDRDDIIAQGLDILKRRLTDKAITYPDGRDYDWK
ncbi:MAG: hypothetical protein GF401_06290 [Chitinivibrionales bacterium]|nr:hypothetical protein [Chitinivibrionales bacterium]